MSVYVIAKVMHESEATGNDRLVLLAIADEADDDGGSAFPSQVRIAHKARLARSTTQRCIKRLEDRGELEIERPERQGQGPGRGRFNRYRLPKYARERPQSEAFLEPVKAQKGPERPTQGEALPIDPYTRTPNTAPSSRKARKRDPIFDGLVEVFGPAEPKTRAAFYGRVAAELREVIPAGLSEDDKRRTVVARGERCRRRFTDATPQALVKHWPDLGPGSEGPRLPKATRSWGPNAWES